MYYIIIINTKYMNATMSLRLDKWLKDDFTNYAKSLWVEPSMLLRRFMDWCLKRTDSIKIDINEELFDNIVKSEKSISRLKVLWEKLKKIW